MLGGRIYSSCLQYSVQPKAPLRWWTQNGSRMEHLRDAKDLWSTNEDGNDNGEHGSPLMTAQMGLVDHCVC